MVFQNRLPLTLKLNIKRLPTMLCTLINKIATDYSKDAWGLLFKMEHTRICTRLFFSIDLTWKQYQAR